MLAPQSLAPPETGGSNATSSPSAIGVERAARSPFTTNDDTAATAANRSPKRADSASTTSPTVLPGRLGLGGVGGLTQRGEQPHPDHDNSSVSWITRASRRPNAGVSPSSAWPNPSPSSSRFGSPAASYSRRA